MSDPDSDPPDGGTDSPQPGHRCTWVWDGIAWQGSMTGCSIEETCSPPAQAGFFIGQTATTDCESND